jgi:GNAT superfamily N-acetyltransferase
MIRPARLHEADDVVALLNAITSLDGDDPIVITTGANVHPHLLEPDPPSVPRATKVDGVVAGFFTGNIVFDATRAVAGCVVLDLFVRQDFRRHDIARALMAALAAETRIAGAVCLWRGVDEGDDQATAFYTALGADSEGGFDGRTLVGAAFDTIAHEAAP